jgi:MoxR-like ATPase
MEFPNDLLHELDRMSFAIAETGVRVTAQQRPIVVITSNNEKELPDAFLRRCVFHYISFPDKQTMVDIVRATTLPDVDTALLGGFGVGQGAYLIKKAALPNGVG